MVGLLLLGSPRLFAQAAADGEQGAAAAQATAIARDLQSTLLDLSRRADETPFVERFNQLLPVVERSHDLAHIARLVTGRHWRNWEEAQQLEFQQAFGRLTVSLYAGRLVEFRGDSFKVLETADQPRGIQRVSSELKPDDGEALGFDFLLHETDQGWRIINIIVDGVSDLALRRSEYSRILDESGYQALLADIRDEQLRLASDTIPQGSQEGGSDDGD
jgi:phospholipid transport system substrate-binding protein